jgi:hypothetical protein
MTAWQPTSKDLDQIRQAQLTPEAVAGQLEKFMRGTTPVQLLKPCTRGDGIEDLAGEHQKELIALYEASRDQLDVLKFVPASGAATRMFKSWFNLIEASAETPPDVWQKFADTLPSYAFADALEKRLQTRDIDMRQGFREGKAKEIMAAVITEDGLNYGHLPKALLLFHRYAGQVRTAMEEHFVEAAAYARGRDNLCRIHFTVSPEFRAPIQRLLDRIIPEYELLCGVTYHVELSEQKAETDTVAVDLENCPFRDEKGDLVFRPAGHGALLMNLNELNADVIFIKNIDNIAHESFIKATADSKKMLAGCLLQHRKRVFGYLEQLSQENVTVKIIDEISIYCTSFLHLSLPVDFPARTPADKVALLFTLLNRPLRVCGMVRNTGEPGGGPFWVKQKNGESSLQIIEQFQVDGNDAAQMTIWSASTHFNPVDLVCSIRDYRGRKFDLAEFADQDAVCISVKSEKGRALKALELPGLWNGAMAGWISLFLEVPLETFNPVKTVEDLLRREHRPA